MIQLPFSCYCSEPTMRPENWKSTKNSLERDWYIYYRFYDPAFIENINFKKGRLVIAKGMNYLKDRTERQIETQNILERSKKIIESSL